MFTWSPTVIVCGGIALVTTGSPLGGRTSTMSPPPHPSPQAAVPASRTTPAHPLVGLVRDDMAPPGSLDRVTADGAGSDLLDGFRTPCSTPLPFFVPPPRPRHPTSVIFRSPSGPDTTATTSTRTATGGAPLHTSAKATSANGSGLRTPRPPASATREQPTSIAICTQFQIHATWTRLTCCVALRTSPSPSAATRRPAL